jgi:hypothetical protein
MTPATVELSGALSPRRGASEKRQPPSLQRQFGVGPEPSLNSQQMLLRWEGAF